MNVKLFKLLILRRIQKRLSVVAGAICWLLIFPGSALAIDASGTRPIIRVDPGTHSAPATGIRFFDKGTKIVTVSLDKTIRIWRSRDFKLLRTLRIPIDFGLEGRLYFADVNPQGTRLVAGGHTCFEWEKRACLYVFDLKTGRMLQRVSGLRGTIANLKFSSDGKTLAVGMTEGGVVFFNALDFSVKAKDEAFGSAAAGLDTSANGYTAVSGLDGYLRIYDSAFKLVARQKIPDLKMIGSTFFSPDGSKLLLGSFETPRFEILSFPALQKIGFVDLNIQVGNQLTLRNVFWSSSGDYLFGSGDSQDSHKSVIYRWQAKALGKPLLFQIPTHRIEGMRAFIDDKLMFSTEDGFVGTADKNGTILATSEQAIIQFPEDSRAFQLSKDGSIVAFPTSQDEHKTIVFDTKIPGVVEALTSLPKLMPANRLSQKFDLTLWKDSDKPMLNGRRLEMLNAFEKGRCFAIAPKDKALVLGTEAALRAYNKKGDLLWKTILASGAAWNVAVTPNGKLVVATLSDGSIRWYRMSDGREMLALFFHANQRDWMLWRPDGYYASSELGDNMIGWHVDRGKDIEPDFYRAVQFERQFYRPDLLRNQIVTTAYKPPKTSYFSGKAKGISKTAKGRGGFVNQVDTSGVTEQSLDPLNIHQINSIAPARIRIDSSFITSSGEIEITVNAEKTSLPMQDVTVYVNLLPVSKSKERRLEAGQTGKFRRTFRFPASKGDNLIRVEVNNGTSIGLAEQLVEAPAVKQVAPTKGNLYLLAVGVNRFDHISTANKATIPDLKYADNDAVKLTQLIQNSGINSKYNKINVRLLADSSETQPTYYNILEALRFLEQAEPNDTAVLFLASHGFSDQKGNYYFLPKDGRFPDVTSVLTGRNLTGKSPTLLSWTDFIDSMRKASGRRVMIVDTCRAKNIFGEFDSRSLRKRSAAALFPLLLASKGDESSQEYEPTQHGLFTHALLEGLRGLADSNLDLDITVVELGDFAEKEVKKLHNQAEGTQTPQLIAPGELGKIGLPVMKPR